MIQNTKYKNCDFVLIHLNIKEKDGKLWVKY